MTVKIVQTKFNKNAYNRSDPTGLFVGYNYLTLDPLLQQRTAHFIEKEADGEPATLTETHRDSALQAVYYKEYLNWKNNKIEGPHHIHLASPSGSSTHEFDLSYDAAKGHPLRTADNKLLAKYGLIKPLWNKGETWHVQLIELTSGSMKTEYKKFVPYDLVPMLVAKFGFNEETLTVIQHFGWAADFAEKLLLGQKDFSNECIDYFDNYRFWESFEKKTGIY